MLREISMYTDDNGLIVQKDGDGGDSAQREGMYRVALYIYIYFLQKMLPVTPIHNDFTENLKLLTVGPGEFVRNPVHYSDPKDFSRDQTVPLLVAMGMYSLHKDSFVNSVEGIKQRGYKAQNGDWMIFNLGTILRGFHSTSWLLNFLDVSLVFDSLNICFWKARKPGIIRQWLGKNVHWIFTQGEPNGDEYGDNNVGTDLNHIVVLLQSELYHPTIVSKLAVWIYKTFRPHGIQYALDTYFSEASGGNTDLAKLYKPIVETYLEK